MTESAGLTLIETQVNAVNGFASTGTAENIAIAKWGILNTGKSDHYAIITPGPTERLRISFGFVDNGYRTIIEVWQRYKDDGTTLTTLIGYVDAIAARLDQYRQLADTTNKIRDAQVSGFSEVTEQWRNNADGPSWLKRDIYVDWKEESNVSYQE